MKKINSSEKKKVLIDVVIAITVVAMLTPIIFSAVRVGVLADFTISTRPTINSKSNEPFKSGIGGSRNFRIPAMVTLDDGTIIASADARWNHFEDSSNIDTLVSVSRNNGASWEHTFACYFGDYNNKLNDGATCFIDSALATDGTTAYMVVGLNPSGYGVSSSMYKSQKGKTGFDNQNRLLLRAKDSVKVPFGSLTYSLACHNADYDFYLDYTDDTRSAYGVYSVETGDRVEGVEVDLHFNLTYATAGKKETTNVFFHNSPYQVYPTTYLYFISSTDGLNWSAPTLLNLKTDHEDTLLIAPGNGIYDNANDRLIFTAYSHTQGKKEYASVIWRDGDGRWHRSENATVNQWSSESSCVLLDDDTLRVFYRSGDEALKYTDFFFDESQNSYVRKEGSVEIDTGAVKTANCQLSALKYSKDYEGKELILVSTPTAKNKERRLGKIYAFSLGNDGTMTPVSAYSANEISFGYSCLAELSNGDIAVLYERNAGEIVFETITLDEILQ